MAFGNKAPNYTDEEFDRLAQLVLETVSKGGTVVEACNKFEEETKGLRTASSARFKWTTRLAKKYEFEYAQAKDRGQQIVAQRIAEHQKPHTPNVRRIISGTSDSSEPVRMTQRDLIKFLRDIEIVDMGNVELQQENESLRKQMEDVVRERDELKHKYLLAQKKLEESQAELEQMVSAFNVARRHVTGAPDTQRTRVVVGRDGMVQGVEEA